MYRQVLRAPHVRALVICSLIARVPLGITTVALVLFVQQQTGSFTTAGVVTAAFGLSTAVLSVLMGRLIDRHGQTFVLLGAMTIYCVALAALVALALSDASTTALVACAIAVGAQPPMSSALRPLWPQLLPADQPQLLPTAYALDALLTEAVFVGGPLVTGVLIAVSTPQVALVLAIGFMAAGVIGFVATEPSRQWRSDAREPGGLIGALSSPGMKTLSLAALGIGSCFGALEVAFAAFGTSHHTPGLAGWLIAINATASMIAGIWYGANANRVGPIHRAYVALVCVFGPLFALVAAAPVLGAVMLMAALIGFATAPLITAQSLLVGELAPRGRLTESFTWLVTAVIVGVAIGNAVAGWLTDAASWRVAVLGTSVLAVAAAVITITRRGTLVAQESV